MVYSGFVVVSGGFEFFLMLGVVVFVFVLIGLGCYWIVMLVCFVVLIEVVV